MLRQPVEVLVLVTLTKSFGIAEFLNIRLRRKNLESNSLSNNKLNSISNKKLPKKLERKRRRLKRWKL